jgi:tetratricopeptide (TPR) repeat protein
MALSEIEKLERRYAENPQGLTFAPLAEVHRKNGDVARALDLLRAGLTLHPDYIPASIVLGRCHMDLGDLPAAEAAFTHVLALDGENVIALKGLADITERLYRFDEADRWLRTLLAIDRSNDEARDQLGRVETARRQAEAASSASPDAGSATGTPAEPAAASSESGSEPLVHEPILAGGGDGASDRRDTPPAVSPPSEPRDAMLGWMSESDSVHPDEPVPLGLEALDLSVESGPPPEGIQLEESLSFEEPVEPLAGVVGLSDSQRDGLVDSPHDGLGTLELSEEFRVETAEDIVLQSSGGSEFQVANAAEELLTGGRFGHPEAPPPDAQAAASFFTGRSALDPDVPPIEAELPPIVPAPEPEPAKAQPEPMPEPPSPPSWMTRETETAASSAVADSPPVAPPAPWAAPVAEPPRRVEADLLVTESMAVLLAQQGHAAEALTVYRHLESRSTGEPRFADKIAELEREVAARQTASEPAPAPVAAAETPRPAYSVLQTQGQSVQAFLRGVFGAKLPAGSPGHHAEPARVAAAAGADPDGAPTRPAHDSLSLSSVFGEESTPTPPAVPAAGSGGPGGVSFDEFFGAPGASTTPRPPRAPDSKTDDLDQFHAWLQNLKR